MEKEKSGNQLPDEEQVLDPALRELADMADDFGRFEMKAEVRGDINGDLVIEQEGAKSDGAGEENVEGMSTEQLTQKIEIADGYEVYGPELEERLKRDEEAARLNTLEMERDPNRDGSLILVCAQHPLTPEGKPRKAFAARLDEAIMRYSMMKKQGQRVTIRVPGAVHFGDSVSLADAGMKYLIENGIPEEDISADGTEENGTDEVVFAYNIFEQAQHKQFHICCGENQVPRNKMACIELLGFWPYFHTTTVPEDTPHALGFEIGNPRGALRFLRVDRGVAVDDAAKAKHIEGEKK